jgi:hypothetical protein
MGQVSFCGAFSMILSLNPVVFCVIFFIFSTSCREFYFLKDLTVTLGQIGLIYVFWTNIGSIHSFCT